MAKRRRCGEASARLLTCLRSRRCFRNRQSLQSSSKPSSISTLCTMPNQRSDQEDNLRSASREGGREARVKRQAGLFGNTSRPPHPSRFRPPRDAACLGTPTTNSVAASSHAAASRQRAFGPLSIGLTPRDARMPRDPKNRRHHVAPSKLHRFSPESMPSVAFFKPKRTPLAWILTKRCTLHGAMRPS